MSILSPQESSDLPPTYTLHESKEDGIAINSYLLVVTAKIGAVYQATSFSIASNQRTNSGAPRTVYTRQSE